MRDKSPLEKSVERERKCLKNSAQDNYKIFVAETEADGINGLPELDSMLLCNKFMPEGNGGNQSVLEQKPEIKSR